jgi:holo-[acyl-carrier protein] synthase
MIYGIGIDTIEVPRIAASIATYGDQFIHRIFAEEEIRYCNSRKNTAEHFAARFAAKEALSKALGTGIRNGFRWKESIIGKEMSGKPIMKLTGSMKNLADSRIGGEYQIQVSLTHTKEIAEAMVIIERL